jgi:PAS domain S-box-containing protein
MDTNFYQLLENFTTGVVIHNANTEVIYSNQAALIFLGLSIDQIQGKSATDPRWQFIREDGSTMPLEEYPVYQVLTSRKMLLDLVVGVIRPDLDYPVWGLCNAHPEMDDEGNVDKVVLNFTDISERKQIENKLLESEKRFSNAFIYAPIGMALVSLESKFLKVNPALCSILGYSENELSSLTFRDITYPEDLDVTNLFTANLLLPDNKILRIENRYFHKKRHIIWVNISVSIVRDEQNQPLYFLAQIQDITQKKQADIELNKALENAKVSALSKSRFLDIAAHELRTPVTAFSLLLQLTQKKLEKGIPVDSPTLNRLRSQVERISQLVIELLDVSRLERGTLDLKTKPTDLISMISQCINDFKVHPLNRNINFIKPPGKIEINIDPLRIYQVLSNLIDNAIKYTSDNLPIEISVETRSGLVRVSVKDQGEGISEKQQHELFAPFMRGESEETEKAGGLGLGLFISHEIIALHGGSIGVTSQMGVGSTFYFELPV